MMIDVIRMMDENERAFVKLLNVVRSVCTVDLYGLRSSLLCANTGAAFDPVLREPLRII